jgi:hypothetical protein
MDYFFAHVHGAGEEFERHIDHIDGPFDPGAKSSGFGKQYFIYSHRHARCAFRSLLQSNNSC